jgi:hypothetical protein
MNINFIPLTVIWALLAIVVIALIFYRKIVSSEEDESLHLDNPAETTHQVLIAHKLVVIDKWGKLLTVIAFVYGLLLASAFTYQTWLALGSTGL